MSKHSTGNPRGKPLSPAGVARRRRIWRAYLNRKVLGYERRAQLIEQVAARLRLPPFLVRSTVGNGDHLADGCFTDEEVSQ